MTMTIVLILVDLEALTHGDNRDMSCLQKLMEKPGCGQPQVPQGGGRTQL